MRLFIYIAIFFFCCYPCYSQSIETDDNITADFKIENIISVRETYRSEIIQEGDNESSKVIVDWIEKKQGLYIIYAIMQQDSSQIIIVSKNKRYSGGEKIKEDSLYSIRLNLEQKEDFLIPDHLLVFEIILEGKTFKVPSEGWSSRLYTSPDLVGLRIKEANFD